MSATLIEFPKLASCPGCYELLRAARLDAHKETCGVLRSKRMHPSARGAASDGGRP